MRGLACNASWYLLRHGDAQGCHDFAGHLRERWRQRLGDDHHHTLLAARNLAAALGPAGRFDIARRINEENLVRQRRILGADHRDTMVSATNLAVDLRALGDAQGARELDADILARRRRLLGEDHTDTLNSATGPPSLTSRCRTSSPGRVAPILSMTVTSRSMNSPAAPGALA
jgi:hypothetical protein